MIETGKLSNIYKVRVMDDEDADDIVKLCEENTQFYEYSNSHPAKENILNDLHIAPPGKELSSKYYVGFYDGHELIAVMDLIDGYPEDDVCFIGFFMMNRDYQGRNIGSSIINDTCGYLREKGYRAVNLGIDKGNPQSSHFWHKNGFKDMKEIDKEGHTIVYCQRIL